MKIQFQLDEVQFERLQMASEPQPALMAKGDPVAKFWQDLGRDMRFDPATVEYNATRDEAGNDWKFMAEPLPESVPQGETTPHESDGMTEAITAEDPAAGFAKIAGDDLRRADPERAAAIVKTATGADTALALVVTESELEPESAQTLLNAFTPYVKQAKEWIGQVQSLTVTSEDDTRLMKMAREARLGLREIRIKAEKLRVKLKADSMRRAKAIDGIYHVIEYLIAPVEERMKEQEEFAIRAGAARKAALKEERDGLLAPYMPDPLQRGLMQLGELDATQFQTILDGCKAAAAAKVAADKAAADKKAADAKAEEDRRAKEKADQEQRERDLKAQADKAEADKAEAERLAALAKTRMVALSRFAVQTHQQGSALIITFADGVKAQTVNLEGMYDSAWNEMLAVAKRRFDAEAVKVKAQRDKEAAEKKKSDDAAATEKKRADAATAELQRKKDADAKAERDRKKADDDAAKKKLADERKAARAPDKQKIEAYIKQIEAIAVPDMKTQAGEFALGVIREQIVSALDFAKQTAGEL